MYGLLVYRMLKEHVVLIAESTKDFAPFLIIIMLNTRLPESSILRSLVMILLVILFHVAFRGLVSIYTW